jgi:hypothetical protein
MKDPSLRVAVGRDAYEGVMAKIKEYEAKYKKYEAISSSTDFDE